MEKPKIKLNLQLFTEYDAQVSRTDAAALIPEEVTREIMQSIVEQSAALKLMKKLPNMSKATLRIPVLSLVPVAYFTGGDTELRKTSEQNWTNKYIYAEEVNVIVPIPELVINDADYDLWSQIKPQIVEAFGKKIDGAVFFGTNKPANWPSGIVTQATSASQTVALGTGADVYEDIMGESGILAKIEEDGFMANGHVAALSMKAKLRGLRDANGQPIFLKSMAEKSKYELDGEPIEFPRNGAFLPASALLISGDFSQAVYSVRQDMQYKVLDQAVIQDDAGAIVYNLAQQRMVALMATMRLGWQVPNPINRVQEVEASRCPFAVLTPAS